MRSAAIIVGHALSTILEAIFTIFIFGTEAISAALSAVLWTAATALGGRAGVVTALVAATDAAIVATVAAGLFVAT